MRRGLPTLLVVSLLVGLAGCARNPEVREQRDRSETLVMLQRAQEMKANGDLILARDLLLQAAELSPRPVIFYEIGNTYYQLGQYAQAEAYYLRALEMAPFYTLAQAELDLVRERLAAQDAAAPPPTRTTAPAQAAPVVVDEPAPAIASETHVAAEHQKAEAPLVTVAEALPEAEPLPAAQRPTTTTTPAGGLAGLSQMFDAFDGGRRTGGAANLPQPEEVRSILFPELDSPDLTDPVEQTRLAEDAERLGQFDEAVRRWGLVLAVQPDNTQARLRLANSLFRSGRSRRAEEEFQLAQRLRPEDPEVYFARGNFFVQTREPEAARNSFLQALTLDPRMIRAHNNLGALELERGNAGAAVAHFEEATRLDPDFAPAWLNLALALDRSGAPARRTIEVLERYASVGPGLDARTDRWLRQLRARAESEL